MTFVSEKDDYGHADSTESMGPVQSTTMLISGGQKNWEKKALEDSESGHKNKHESRDSWSGKFDFILACCGSAVGLGNVWRFPYLCYNNGGGAFLIPYAIIVVFSGIPIFLLEVALGQYYNLGCIEGWNSICPLMSGIGLSSTVIIFLTLSYYAVILAWSLMYLFNSFRAVLPWESCNNIWNNHLPNRTCSSDLSNVTSQYKLDNGINGSLSVNDSKWLKDNYISAVEEYYKYEVLNQSDGMGDLGAFRWELAGYLVITWLVCYFTVFKGTKSSGKAMYFTATFPYVMLFILLAYGLTLPGAGEGIIFYLKPNMTKLMESQVWRDAGTQVFFSYSLCIGVLISLGSFNNRNNNCVRDTVIIACVNSGTSFLAGFAIFAALGNMAHQQGVDVKDVVDSGPGLAFVAYPQEVLNLPCPQFWSILFFFMLFLLGMSTLLTDTLALITSLGDLYPELINGKYRKPLCMGIGCTVMCCIGFIMTTQGGIYTFQLFDSFGASGFTLLWSAFWQCITVSWFFGSNKLESIFEEMMGFKPSRYFMICWKYLSPLSSVVIFVYNIVNYEELTYGDYKYPTAGLAFGWFLALLSMICIPIRAAYVLWHAEGNSLQEKFLFSIQSKPAGSNTKVEWSLCDESDSSEYNCVPPYSEKDPSEEKTYNHKRNGIDVETAC